MSGQVKRESLWNGCRQPKSRSEFPVFCVGSSAKRTAPSPESFVKCIKRRGSRERERDREISLKIPIRTSNCGIGLNEKYVVKYQGR